ncbi:hypothetical protein SAICODRAFT_27131 [Saitoella complicata NRRL Y-17804]|nr:uncharacterized protein SAICODRAFT_27131 [Saitoella complicata NRRL Y-17804]ODQ51080.1 hypothetical protein SAICODRAFT_27131 [Saitoella complicata NRRL Y-17804]
MVRSSLFIRQVRALCRKNLILFTRHWFLNLIRCLILPVAFIVFLGEAQNFFSRPATYGFGNAAAVKNFATELGSGKFVWIDRTGSSGGEAQRVVDIVTARVTRGTVVQLQTSTELAELCPQNFIGASPCFAAVEFNQLDFTTNQFNYTLRADTGSNTIRVDTNSGSFEQKVLPLQWAIDQAIFQISNPGGTLPPTPLEQPYTQISDEDRKTDMRLSYLSGVRTILALAFFIGQLGVVYQLVGHIAEEREALITDLLDSMSCLRTARFASFHLSYSIMFLPSWILMGVTLALTCFTKTNIGLVIVFHFLNGFALTSWSLFAGSWFRKAQMSGISATIAAVIMAIIAQVIKDRSSGSVIILSLIFPPMTYIFGTLIMTHWERELLATNVVQKGPSGATMLGVIIMLLVQIVVYPFLAAMVEDRMFHGGFFRTFRRSKASVEEVEDIDGAAVVIRGLNKDYVPRAMFRKEQAKRNTVHAVKDLSLTVHKGQVYGLLGANGSGKSTTLGMISGSISITSGSIIIDGNPRLEGKHLPQGILGVCPQKNVIWDTLTVRQHVEIWQAIKGDAGSVEVEDIDDLIDRCDLSPKAQFLASNLSGGQKRKLGLAICFVGGSRVCLLDEISSGLDPVSRHVIWNIILHMRGQRTMIMTSHFLDECDVLCDDIAILSKGQLQAQGSSVELKARLGEGWSVVVKRVENQSVDAEVSWMGHDGTQEGMVQMSPVGDDMRDVAAVVQSVVPTAVQKVVVPGESVFRLRTSDPVLVARVMQVLDEKKEQLRLESCDLSGPTLEDVFLRIMEGVKAREEQDKEALLDSSFAINSEDEISKDGAMPIIMPAHSRSESSDPINVIGGATTAPSSSTVNDASAVTKALDLSDGRRTGVWEQTIFVLGKRWLIMTRGWFSFIAPLLVVVFACGISTVFINSGYNPGCDVVYRDNSDVDLTFPMYDGVPFVVAPSANILSSLLNSTSAALLASAGSASLQRRQSTDLASSLENAPFLSLANSTANLTFKVIAEDSQRAMSSLIEANRENLDSGGLHIDIATSQATFTWLAEYSGLNGPSLLNLADNILYNDATGSSGLHINTYFRWFESKRLGDTGKSLQFIVFFGLSWAVYPAFAALYPTRERLKAVKAFQFSNGMKSTSLWLGHFLYELPMILLSSTVVVILFAAITPGTWNALGLLWLVLVFYSTASVLLAFIVSLFATSQLAAFALSAGTGCVYFLLYVAGYLLTLTYAPALHSEQDLRVIHYTMSLLFPIASLIKAAFVSLNAFALACDGNKLAGYFGGIDYFGGPILYLILQSLLYFGILIWYDSGRWRPRKGERTVVGESTEAGRFADTVNEDVAAEAARIDSHPDDVLQVSHLVKTFKETVAVNDISFGVSRGSCFALLGPNGAGKTTTFSMLRGELGPDSGDASIAGISISQNRNEARQYLGVCPQFDAMDSLTVREHLAFYARIKGIPKSEVVRNVEVIIEAVGLTPFATRLGDKLSGGNQRKLTLGSALLGNPTCLLIDEASSGMDAASKRVMWKTIAKVTPGRAIVITTHSMEEADALANRSGILAKRFLAFGTIRDLKEKYGAGYSVACACESPGDVELLTKSVRERYPDAIIGGQVYGTNVKYRIPKGAASVADIFKHMEHIRSVILPALKYSVSGATLEEVFVSVVEKNNIKEEGADPEPTKVKRGWRRFVAGSA